MSSDIKLQKTDGIRLEPIGNGIARAVVHDRFQVEELTWDRYMRLRHTAQQMKSLISDSEKILDVGGYDGALAFFLETHEVDVIDPITTGGSGLSLPDVLYSSVVSIDSLEHVSPESRSDFVDGLLNAAVRFCFINFPSPGSLEAQKLALEVTNNPLIREHVDWDLPDANEVSRQARSKGFSTRIYSHTSTAQWLPQYILQTVAPEEAAMVARYLRANHFHDSVKDTLYDLVICTRDA